MVDVSQLIRSLEAQASRIYDWLSVIEAPVMRWKPAPDRWSMLEVVGHLCDEERDDFRARMRMMLAGVSPWPPIDPEGWVVANGWQARRPQEAVEEWKAERHASLQWLGGLDAPDWSAFYEHPEAGRMTAADLLASWSAHDLLHEAQLVRLGAEQFIANVAPLSTRYAAP